MKSTNDLDGFGCTYTMGGWGERGRSSYAAAVDESREGTSDRAEELE